jgi:general secretion pathway protein F
MDEALAALADQSQTPRIGKIVAALRSKVLEGEPLAQALAAFPASFPELFRAGVAAGESSGQLGVALTRLADHAERRAELGRALLGALAYPLLLTVVAIAVVSGLLVYVVPQIVHVFEHVGQKLPLLTRALIALSVFARSFGLIVIALVVAAALAARAAFRREAVRERLDRALLKLPLFGRLLRASDAARATATLATLSASGVPLLEALRLTVGSARLAPMRNALRGAALRVREGQGFARALAESGQFPPVALRLIASGEKSGRLDAMLDAAAAHEQHEVSTRIAALTAVLGPLVILFVGALVLLIVLAILLPIFELNSLIK